MSNFPPPTCPPPPSDSSDHESSSDISSMEDVDLIQWDLEMSGQPGGRRFQLPTLPAHGPRPAGKPGQAAKTGALGAGCQPGLPIISPPHQNQQTSAPPVPEPGNHLAGPSSGDRPQLAAASSRPPAAHHRETAPTAGGEATAPWPAGDLLGVLRQMQEQQIRYQQRQQHQQEVVTY